MTPLRTAAFILGVALPVGVVLYQVLPQWKEDPAKVRRECITLVDALMHHDPTIWPHELDQELIERGVTLPSSPSLTFGTPPGRDAKTQLREYESAKKAYEAKWDEIKGSAEYQRAREAVLNRNPNRDKRLSDCLSARGVRERAY